MSAHPTIRLVSVLVISGLTAAGCSLVLDDSTGLGPPGCFIGEPTAPNEFANQCTTAQTYQFDNCARLGLCDDKALAASFSATVAAAINGKIPKPLYNPPPPTANCSTAVNGANVIYMTGSTNLPPLLKAVQPLLYANSPPYVAVFAPQTSCIGAASMYDADLSKHLIVNTMDNWAFYYNASGIQTFCLLDTSGNLVDVGESDVYPSSCGYDPKAGIADYSGPIQAIAFVVPSGSKQTSISAEAAHLVFATGGDNGKVAPWIDPYSYFVRSSGTGTIQLPSLPIGINPASWWGIDQLSAGNLMVSMEAIDPSLAEKGIGLLSSDFADKSRANLRELAFQQRGQHYGYLPDSTPASFDKANVRDGHYPIWGAIHLMAATVGGVPSEAARALIPQLTEPKLDQTLVSAIVDAGFVPPCAMKVTHSTEVGPLSSFQPQFGCGCFYDKKVNGATACKVCGGPGDCSSSAPACNYGYCEKQ